MEVSRSSIKTAMSSSFRRLRCSSLNSVRLRRIFDLFDKNHDGSISVAELSQAFQCLGWDADLSELEKMVKSHTNPGNTGLCYNEFEALHATLNDTLFGGKGFGEQEIMDEELSDLKEAFKVFDENGDGYISARELQVVLGKLGLTEEGAEMDRVERMICSVDKNRDGRIDFSEFKDMMCTVIVPS